MWLFCGLGVRKKVFDLESFQYERKFNKYTQQYRKMAKLTWKKLFYSSGEE